MKKNVVYAVDLLLDENGTIIESQCECAVGMGPDAHCKHVSVTLLAMVDFSLKGSFHVQETCTERLQTFHKTKRFKGSPLKANSIKLKSNPTDKSILQQVDYDPRPEKFRNREGYAAFATNIMLNFQTSEPMPILQTIPPANIKALCHDHDYMDLPPEDQFLEKNNISTITPTAAAKIEESTRGQSSNSKWKEERLLRVHSSHFGRICKATERTDFNNLARSLVTHKDIKSSAICHGIKYEASAVKMFEEITEMDTSECGIFVSQNHPYLASSPDRIVDDDTLLEVKCPFVAKDKPISHITVPYLQLDDNDNLKLDPTHDYYYQIQGQLYCSDRRTCWFVVFTLKDTKIIKISRDENFIVSMLSTLQSFYETYFRQALIQKFIYKDTDKYTFHYK